MKQILSLSFFLMVSMVAGAQQFSQVTFNSGFEVAHIAFTTNQNVVIRVSVDGQVLEWGREVVAEWGNYHHPSLQPFLARVDYYGKEADVALQGKVRNIGTCMLSYYSSFEPAERAGKLRTVGPLMIDYYTSFDNEAFRGRIKSIGNMPISYYASYDDGALRGKLKQVGSTMIQYHNSFDDPAVRGKIKSIGHATYSWYGSYDAVGYSGGMRSGSYRQQVGGVTYILR